LLLLLLLLLHLRLLQKLLLLLLRGRTKLLRLLRLLLELLLRVQMLPLGGVVPCLVAIAGCGRSSLAIAPLGTRQRRRVLSAWRSCCSPQPSAAASKVCAPYIIQCAARWGALACGVGF
jgi:hypothetical protein